MDFSHYQGVHQAFDGVDEVCLRNLIECLFVPLFKL